jgi:hypothetical protein
MPICLQCPSCGALVAVSEAAVGQVWSCGRCRQQFQVPVLPSQLPPPPVEAADSMFDVTSGVTDHPPDEPPRRLAARRRQAAAPGPGFLVWIIVIPSLVSLTILTGLYLYRLTSEPAKKPAPAPPPMKRDKMPKPNNS